MDSPYVVEWHTQSNILAGGNLQVGVAGDENAVSALQIANCAYCPRLRFGLFADQAITLKIEVALNAVWRTQISIAVPASLWFDVYRLPAPVSDNGYLILGLPLVRINLANPGGADTADLTFWAQAF